MADIAPLCIRTLSGLTRTTKIIIHLLIDTFLIILSFFGAMLFRLENYSFLNQPQIWDTLGYALIAALAAFSYFGLYRTMARYITGKVLFPVGLGILVSAATMFGAGLVLDANLPRSVPLIFATFAFLAVGGLRFVARTILRNPDQLNRRPVIIYGAKDVGLQLLNSLFHGRDYLPVALVDEDKNLQNLTVGGLNVFSPRNLPQLLRETGATAILLAIPDATRAHKREIVDSLQHLKVEIKTIPSMSEFISGRAKISELKTISAEDLLGRDPIPPDQNLLRKNIAGSIVMVSGAGGSIGSELCRQILNQHPSTLVLYELSEFALYTIETELARTVEGLNYSTKIISILGSVTDKQRVDNIVKTFNVKMIYHAAAYKHVPIVEENVIEAIRNNIFGTLAIADAARKNKVENFILVSTDKAVRPTNIMGATKRVAELICQAYAQDISSTLFSMVRFGNVLGSSGSVIPLFHVQIERGGPVTVTHKDINRYFMTIPEASQLVIQAGAMAKGGDVFVLDMGEPVKILDLAMSMIRLHGLEPYVVDHPDQFSSEKGDIPICVTGLRKGEKLYEELLIGNNPAPTQHPRIMTASEASLPIDELMAVMHRLQNACGNYNLPEIIAILNALPIEYTPSTTEIFDVQWNAAHIGH